MHLHGIDKTWCSLTKLLDFHLTNYRLWMFMCLTVDVGVSRASPWKGALTSRGLTNSHRITITEVSQKPWFPHYFPQKIFTWLTVFRYVTGSYIRSSVIEKTLSKYFLLMPVEVFNFLNTTNKIQFYKCLDDVSMFQRYFPYFPHVAN